MGEPWSKILERVLQPERPLLARCLDERKRSLSKIREAADARARALQDCELRIDALRTAVFAATDGVVPKRMTELEREWRWRSRQDTEAELTALWTDLATSVAPPAWVDRKAWRDSDRPDWADAAVALAADADNVQRAESAVAGLRERLLAYGPALPNYTRWRLSHEEGPGAPALLDGALGAARRACSPFDRDAILTCAERDSRRVHDSLLERFPTCANLAGDFARAAFLDFVWQASSLPQDENPVGALRLLWQAGYAIAEVDSRSVVLWIPPLDRRLS